MSLNIFFPCSFLQYIIISSLLNPQPLTLFDYKFPDWSITVGFVIGASSFIWIPIYMVYKLVWTPGSLKQVRHASESLQLLHLIDSPLKNILIDLRRSLLNCKNAYSCSHIVFNPISAPCCMSATGENTARYPR